MSSRHKDPHNRESYISAASLLLEYRNFIDSHDILFRINTEHNCWPVMRLYCEQIEGIPDVMKALTMLHAGSQIDFERALFCSWMSLVIAANARLDAVHQRAIFLAGLFQDLGKHAVDQDIQNFISKVNGSYISQLDSNALGDSHPLISSTFLEGLFTDVEGLTDLVLHHHARDDGSGFPHHVGESQLKLDNQILIIANEVSDRVDRMGGHNRLPACIPSLRLGAFSYFKKAHEAWLNVLEPFCDEDIDLDVTRTMLNLEQKRALLSKLLACLLSVSGELLRYDFDLKVHALRSIIQKLAHLFAETGVLHRDIFKVSDDVTPQMLQESAMLFQALPELLYQAESLVSALMSARKFEFNQSLLLDAQMLLGRCNRALDPHRPGIFR